ncbi:MAG: DUF1353 domain-containing protein [Pseudomonadota bacterium]
MNAQFLTRPQLRWVSGDYPWALTAELAYHSPVLAELGLPKHEPGVVRIPATYCTDFASTPRIPGLYWLVGGKATLPAIVHDHLYDCWTDEIPRKVADRVFLEAMAAARDPERWITRRIMYTGVRLGGGRPWRTDSTHKCPCHEQATVQGELRA